MSLALVLPAVIYAADFSEVSQRIRDNDLAWLKQQTGVVEVKDARQNTPLIVAASFGSLESMKMLLAAGANPNEANALGVTPLIAGAIDAEKVKALLAAGADVKTKSQAGRNALIVAASSARSTESVKLLLGAGAPVNERGAQGSTALLAALGSSCFEESVKLLLAAGADAKAVDGANFGAVHGAIACSAPMLREILSRGANVNLASTFGGKVRHGDIQLKGITPLMLAAAHWGAGTVKILLDAGADVNARDVRGMSPLIWAVATEKPNLPVVQMLLAKGADRSFRDKEGQDAAAWASKFNDSRILKALGAKAAPPAVAAKAAGPGPGTLVALRTLEQGNESFFKQSGCGGCHHSNLLSFAASRARNAGLTVSAELAEARRQRLRGQFSFFQPGIQQMQAIPGDIDSMIYGLLEGQSLGVPRSVEFETVARYLWAKQLPDGSWSMRGISRSPIEEADIHRTALALWLVPQFSDAAAKAESATRVREALHWLESQPGITTDERAMKLLGFKWGGASQALIDKAARDLAIMQNKDGSWSGNRRLNGDAYSTGLALFALREGAGWRQDDKHLVHGAQWLRNEQHADGTWYVKSRAPKFQPYFESGFPYGHDQWISTAATAWAVAGLSEVGAIR